MTFDELKESAKRSSSMPDKLKSYEQWTWQALRLLIVRYVHHDINKRGAKQELSKMERAFDVAKLYSDVDYETSKMCNRLSDKFTQAEREGCPICKEIAMIFSGRIKSNEL